MATSAMAQTDAERPLSAIDWLSDSITAPAPMAPPAQQEPQTRDIPTLTVAPLGSKVADLAGVDDGEKLGLPPSLWSKSSAAELARRLQNMPPIAPPSLRRFYARLMASRFAPPADAILDESFYLARVDTLMGLAQLEDARALLEEAGTETPERFRRYFDIGLLTSTEGRACEIIDETPEVSATFPARIFCLARNGEWDVAALTLGTAEALGILSDQEDQLLLRFLDPDLFEGEPPPPPDAMSPLLFRLYESIGERPLTDGLPVAFAVADLSDTVGWKDRLHAAERLTAIGAMSSGEMLAVFNARQPAASGGIWDRVDAIQDFDALKNPDEETRARALSAAWEAATASGYAAEMAPWFLLKIRTATLPREAQHAAFEIALLAGETKAAEQWTAGRTDDAALLDIATERGPAATLGDPLTVSIRQSLAGLPPSPSILASINAGETGAALLGAITVLARGAEGDPRSVSDAIAVLIALGLDDLARQVSVELLLEASRI